jgi:chromosomal replication initiator protein
MMNYSLIAPALLDGFVIATPATAVIRPRLTVARIQDVVARYYDLLPIEMRSKRRAQRVSRPRQIAMYLARELTPKSLPHIGQLFDRDHTTVISAIKRIDLLKTIDGDIADDLAALRARLAA